jgi:hypothetical protein
MPAKSKFTTRALAVGILAVISIAAIPLLMYHGLSKSNAWLDCGTDASTAVARSCVFDLMSFSWLLPDCYDAELTEEFLNYHDASIDVRNETVGEDTQWQWFTSGTGDVAVPLPEVARGEYDELYVSWEYHIVHCVFMWKKLHRAITGSRVVDSYIGNIAHTDHCGRMLLKSDTAAASLASTRRMEHAHSPAMEIGLSTIILTKYPTCGGSSVVTINI